MSVSVTFWGNLADAAYQLRETRFAESLLDGVVRSVAHCDRAADSFCAHIGGQVAAVAIVSRDHHQVVLADRRRLDCDHDLAPPGSATMRAVVVGSKSASRAFNRARTSSK